MNDDDVDHGSLKVFYALFLSCTFVTMPLKLQQNKEGIDKAEDHQI